MSLMLKEIHEQPEVIRGLWNKEKDNIRKVAAEIKRRNIKFAIFAARGTSDHAAIYGKYLFEIKNHMPVGLADASAYTIYDATMNMENVLVIGVSQSGEAKDIGEFLVKSRANGALTVSIVNYPDSKMAKTGVDFSLCCNAGPEKAVAATKTYTSTMAVFYMLSCVMNGDESFVPKMNALADDIEKSFELEKILSDRAERYRYMKTGVALSRGYAFSNALELSLKMAETCYVAMRGYSAADFQHGPIASVHETDPCFIIAPKGKMLGTMKESIDKLAARNAEMVIFSSEDALLEKATLPLKLDTNVDEELSPILYIVPGQLFAYNLSVSKGNDPDNPKGLSKITLTL